MKKVNVLLLIASSCLLLGTIINLLELCMEIPFALSACSAPLLLASVILRGISLKKQLKDKKKNKNSENE